MYGAGERAYRLISGIKGFVNIREIIVSEKEGNPESLLGYSVHTIADWMVEDTDILMVVTVGEKYRKDIERKLLKRRLTNYIFV